MNNINLYHCEYFWPKIYEDKLKKKVSQIGKEKLRKLKATEGIKGRKKIIGKFKGKWKKYINTK